MKKKTAAIAAIASTGVLLTSMVVACSMAAQQNHNNVELNRNCREIRTTQAYIEAKHEYEQQIYEAYQAGTLKPTEYAEKLEYTTTNQYIYDNLDQLATTESQAQIVREINEQKDTVQAIGEGALLTTLGSFFVGSACVIKALPEEQHRGKKKKEQSGSIMSRCRYKDLLDKEDERSK